MFNNTEMLIKGKGCADPRRGKVGALPSIPQFLGRQPQSGPVPAVGAGSAGGSERRDSSKKWGAGSREQKRPGEKKRKEEGRERGKEPQAWRAGARRVAFGAPPDSARGLFIEILAFCELEKQLKLGEIRNEREEKERKCNYSTHLI